MKKFLCIGLLIAAVVMTWIVTVGNQTQAQSKSGDKKLVIRAGQFPRYYEGTYKKDLSIEYLLYLPEDYGKDKDRRWPVVLFLHGSGQRGKKVFSVARTGLPQMLKKKKNFPAIVISPQCPPGRWWNDVDVTLKVKAMLDDVCKKYAVDKKRIYLTGLSMGGFGTWHLAQQYPDTFAALAPICGGGNPWLQKRLIKIPTKVYHGTKDRNVPIAFGRLMYDALKRAGGQVEFIEFPNKAHSIWNGIYKNPKLWEWMFAQVKGQRDPTLKKRSK